MTENLCCVGALLKQMYYCQYIQKCLMFLWCNGPTRTKASTLLRFLKHTHTHTHTIGTHTHTKLTHARTQLAHTHNWHTHKTDTHARTQHTIDTRTHTYTRTRTHAGNPPAEWSTVAEGATYTTHNKHETNFSCSRRDSNPQSQQSGGYRPTP